MGLMGKSQASKAVQSLVAAWALDSPGMPGYAVWHPEVSFNPKPQGSKGLNNKVLGFRIVVM